MEGFLHKLSIGLMPSRFRNLVEGIQGRFRESSFCIAQVMLSIGSPRSRPFNDMPPGLVYINRSGAHAVLHG
jgi:hypothetical protein